MKIEELRNKIIQGHVVDALKLIPDDSIDCIVTSPPYWGLRDYGQEANTVWEGNPVCQHKWKINITKHDNLRTSKVGETTIVGSNKNLKIKTGEKVKNAFCTKCGAWYGQLGLEPTLEMYLEHLLEVVSELKRVLKPTGVMFWVHDDAYASNSKRFDSNKYGGKEGIHCGRASTKDYKRKCMLLKNYRLAMKMIDEQGWILRNIIIWYKKNHMPESVKDRFTNAYEPIFMFVKKERYWFDLDAVRIEPKWNEVWSRKGAKAETPYEKNNPRKRWGLTKHEIATGKLSGSYTDPLHTKPLNIKGKNPGDLWTIHTQPFPEAHFAIFPEQLVEPMIKAACPRWICQRCGRPKIRIVEDEYDKKGIEERRIGCDCNAGWISGIVLDPFLGSGTTALVAKKLNRDFIGIEIVPKYVEMAMKRLNRISLFLPKDIIIKLYNE